MLEPIQPETIRKIEAFLLSGDLEQIELGKMLANSQGFDLSLFQERVALLCNSFQWQGLRSFEEQLLRLVAVKLLVLQIGEGPFEYLPNEAAEGLVFAHSDNFDDLPEDWAGLLPNLQELNIEGGVCDVLPEEIGLLTTIRQLRLQHVFFRQFPVTVGNWVQLQGLEIIHDPAKCTLASASFSLPAEMRYWESLEGLSIQSCLLELLPEQIQLLPALKELKVNCDLEALCADRGLFLKLKNKQLPVPMPFVPETLKSMPSLETLMLILPARHFPLSPDLFRNSRLRRLSVSARLLPNIPLHSPEITRLQQIQLFKPNLLQYMRLSFALPDTEVDVIAHPYGRWHQWRNFVLLLLSWPLGGWYFCKEFILETTLRWRHPFLKMIGYVLIYPFACFLFIGATLYFGIKSLWSK